MADSPYNDTKTYYLQYTIGYAPVSNATQPLTVFSMDATATHTTDCQTEYQVPGLAPGEVNVLSAMVNITVRGVCPYSPAWRGRPRGFRSTTAPHIRGSSP